MILYSALGSTIIRDPTDKTFTFYSSYTGNKYKLYFSAGINNLISYENGGIHKYFRPQSFQILVMYLHNLEHSIKQTVRLKNRNILLVQRYTLGSNPVVKNDTHSP